MAKWLATWSLVALCTFVILSSEFSRASIVITSNPFAAQDPWGLSPFWKWKTIESENFRVTYPEELRDVANQATLYLEEAHRFLSPLMRWQPAYRPQVMVIDNRDSANGLTATFARFGMILWVTPPDAWFGTTFYDDWLRFLVIHEYTHFLNMDITTSFYVPLRTIFGDFLLPNAIWYPWMLEGLAVYSETRFTHSGRGRGSDYEMMLRAAAEEKVLDTPDFITLDKLIGDIPYYPAGDIRYQFGYHLMNQVARQPTIGLTADGKTKTTGQEDLLGIMSERSGGRIPFFIDGNLKNIVGKDWDDLWKEWAEETRERTGRQLKAIQSQPTTSYTLLTERKHEISNDVTGIAASPDGQWLAYTLASADRRQGLYLRNIATGEVKWLNDKRLGAGMKFTPDSETLIFSEVHQLTQYYLLSDLRAYSLADHKFYWISDRLRARDPDVSKDGKWVTFTIAENSMTGLAIAPLEKVEGRYQLGGLQKLYFPPKYDRVSNPQFSLNSEKIFFSFHPNGKFQEDLMEFDRTTGKTSHLVSDGKFNRFPAVRSDGELYYISNATGADNLYHYRPGQHSQGLVTNVTTGLRFPTFGPKPDLLYADLFSYTGWDLAQLEILKLPVNKEAVTLSQPPAPSVGLNSTSNIEPHEYAEKDYSIFPSILPRIWSPLIGLDSNEFAFGAATLGFDAVNRHRYVLQGTYTPSLATGDGYFLYSNRSFGPALNVSSTLLTNARSFSDSGQYSRSAGISTSISHPFPMTYSKFTPFLGFSVQRSYDYKTEPASGVSTFSAASPTVGSVDFSLTFDNRETSNLAVTLEGGRFSKLGTRVYLLPDTQIWQGLLIEQENFRIGKHAILSPSLKGSWVSATSLSFAQGNSILQGRIPNQVIGAFADGFNQFSIRGYPGYRYFSKAALVSALDFEFPILRIFRGWGTLPVFLDNLYGVTFLEASYVPSLLGFSDSSFVLPSAGYGLRLSFDLPQTQIILSAEHHIGFRSDLRGSSDLFFQVFLSGAYF